MNKGEMPLSLLRHEVDVNSKILAAYNKGDIAGAIKILDAGNAILKKTLKYQSDTFHAICHDYSFAGAGQ